MLGTGAQIFWAHTSGDPRLADLLNADERVRAEKLRRAGDRQRFISAHALTRLALASATGRPADELRFEACCATCGGPHGKPHLTLIDNAPQFSLSHSGDRVVVAISETAPVGVDIEHLDGTPFDGFDAVALTPGERAAVAALPAEAQARARAVLWTRKEAALKATGDGLSVSPSRVVVSGPSELARVVEWTDAPTIHLTDLSLGTEYAACVAVLSEAAHSVTVSQTNLAARTTWPAGGRE